MTQRERRREAIRNIVRTQKIKTQKALGDAIAKEGYKCTQATISRDVIELGLAKSAGEGIYFLPEDLHLQRMVHDLALKIEAVDNLIVLKAQTGTAPGVAAALDDVGLKEIVGTVSGDDTILMVAKSAKDAARITKQLSSFMPKGEEE